jgi:putative peptide zinc metalloprotease protein
VNDVLLFRRRRHRVYTAFAGVFAGLLALLPVVPVWLFAPPESSLRHAASALLVFGSLAAVANFIPFLQLDGYFMLNHALGMQNLRIESYRFIGQLLRAPRRDGDSGVLARQAAYPGRVRAIYVLYAAGSALFGIALACWFVYSLFVALQGSLGAVRAGAVVAMAVAAVTFALVTSQRRRRSKVDKPAT